MKSISGFFAALRDYFTVTMRHPIGFIGINLTSFSGVLLVVLLVSQMLGMEGNPYLGIVAFMVLPVIFIAGLIAMPVGHYLHGKRAAKSGEQELAFPVVDFNVPRWRNRAVVLLVLTLVNLSILGVVSYRALQFMDSVEFCGKVCHAVMTPELTAHGNSPHSRVRCVDCHIGPGASWFVKSKLSGTRQVFAAVLKTYPKPIPTPVHNLRPARETCEQCHWPQKFVGNKLVVRTHYKDDEANTATESVLSLKIGGGNPGTANPGIHWHVSSKVDFISDDSREKIYYVRVERADGQVQEFFRPAMKGQLPDSLKSRPMRRMDCVDCHNRPTHIYKPAATALDEAMSRASIPAGLPFFHREALAALVASYPDRPAAIAGIGKHLQDFYAKQYPDVVSGKSAELAQAIAGAQKIYADNVFPSMNIGWDTYPNHLGHQQSPGCFRCHDEELATKDGKTISQDCSTCHSLLAVEEENPPILKQLFPEE